MTATIANGKTETTPYTQDFTITVGGYTILSGSNQTVILGGSNPVEITASGALSEFVGLSCDGVVIDPVFYGKRSGSTVVTLSTSFINGLSLGTHSITFQFQGGKYPRI